MSIVIWLVEIDILFYSILFYCASSVQNPDFENVHCASGNIF
jgi:hypothetical protein